METPIHVHSAIFNIYAEHHVSEDVVKAIIDDVDGLEALLKSSLEPMLNTLCAKHGLKPGDLFLRFGIG